MKWLSWSAAIALVSLVTVWLLGTEPRNEWYGLLDPIGSDGLCDKNAGLRACILERWERDRSYLARTAIPDGVAVSLCEIGGCAEGNIERGPWIRACKHLRWLRQGDYYRIIDPCTCPRGPYMEHFFMHEEWRNDGFLPPRSIDDGDFAAHYFDAFMRETTSAEQLSSCKLRN